MSNQQSNDHHAHHAQRETQHVEKLEWNDGLMLGHGPMDDEHREFVQVVVALRNSTVETALTALAAVEAHLISHFDLEHEWMDKTAFPDVYSKCHRDQHDEVLASVFQVHQLAAIGQIGLGAVHRLAQSLMDWFPGHADYMDSSLSAWINGKTHGGQAVVLRRNLVHEDRIPSGDSRSEVEAHAA